MSFEKSWKTILAAGMIALASHIDPAVASAQETVGLPVGAKATPVTIEDLDGNPVDLSQVIGKKPVLLEFWATWCPLCEELMPSIEAAKKRYGDRLDIVVVAVAVNQSKRSLKRHAAKHELPGRLLWDTDGRATRAFKAPTTSYVVILDKTGKVVYTGVGGDQQLLQPLARVLGK